MKTCACVNALQVIRLRACQSLDTMLLNLALWASPVGNTFYDIQYESVSYMVVAVIIANEDD